MKIKSTLKTWNWKNITLFIVALATGMNATVMVWRLTIEPFYTNQLTTLTWFGVIALVASICIAVTCWNEIWKD